MTDQTQPEIEYVDQTVPVRPPIFAFIFFVLGIIMSLVAWLRANSVYVSLDELNLPAQFGHLGPWIEADYAAGLLFAALGVVGNIAMLCRQRLGLVCGWLCVLCAMISAFATMSVWIAIRGVANPEHAWTFLFSFSWRLLYLPFYVGALWQFTVWSEQLKKQVAPPRLYHEPAWAEYELQKIR